MKDRINSILQKYNMTPSDFADKIGVGKSNISHILGGRNNPSLEIVKRILNEFLDINAEWLLFGTGNMVKSTELPNTPIEIAKEPQLQFEDEKDKDDIESIPNVEVQSHTVVVESDITNVNPVEVEPIVKSLKSSTNAKVVTKVVLYYSDNTYEQFAPNNLPL